MTLKTKYINEGQTSTFLLKFLDEYGKEVIPEKLEYAFVDKNGEELIPWNEIINSQTEIEIPPEFVTLRSDGDINRYLTVKVTHGNGKVDTEELPIKIIDLKGIKKSI